MASYTKLANKVIVLSPLPANSTPSSIQTALDAEMHMSWYYVVTNVFQDGSGDQYVCYSPNSNMQPTAVAKVPAGQDLVVTVDLSSEPWTFSMRGTDFTAENTQHLYLAT